MHPELDGRTLDIVHSLNKTHKEGQNVHILALSLTQSDIVHEIFTNLNSR